MTTRGIRNNNPLNIRRGTKWKGLAPYQSDPEFCQFVSLEAGFRAAIKLLRNYITGWGGSRPARKCLHDIISMWAPDCENDTEAYIKSVALDTDLHPFQVIAPNDRSALVSIALAMAKVECKHQFDRNLVESAYDLSL